MISEIDNALRDLMFHEIPLRKGEVEIDFDQPKREWSARLNKPTLNFYLFDLRENIELRGSEQWVRTDLEDGTIALHRNPTRIDLNYLVTSWAKEVLDEHQLLAKALIALLRQPFLPESYLPEHLKNQPVPIWLEVAQSNILANPSDLWNTLDNDLRPGIRLKVTLCVDPYAPVIVPAVSTTEIGFMQNPAPDLPKPAGDQEEALASPSKSHFMVRGKISSQKYSPSALKVVLAETGKILELGENGEFAISRLARGEYHLDVTANGRTLKRQIMNVPSPKYEFDV
jgi:hypothetical protein